MIDVSDEQLEVVCRLLSRHVPEREVMAFGSRTTGSADRYSDLDIAIMGDEPIGFERLALLKDAFAESDLPFRVDVLQWCRTSPAFREMIGPQLERIAQAKG